MHPATAIKSVFAKEEEKEAYKGWWATRGYIFPYAWTKEYGKLALDVPVALDADTGLPYVLHGGKRLYFCRSGIGERPALERAEVSYRALVREQDERSPHRYVRSYEELRGKVLLDVGAAEAIFTLDTIEYIERAYLFECEEEWIEALQATFAPWKEKVTIVRKYVSDIDDAENVTLDAFFKDKPTANIFLKMDIEGYEQKALKGAEGLLKSAEAISGSVCLYHKHEDCKTIPAMLSACGLKAEVQPGYMYFGGEMRHAIVRFCRV